MAPTIDAPEAPAAAQAAAPLTLRDRLLIVLVVLASVFVLHWAQDVFIPLALSILASYALTPVVNRMQRVGLPRALAAGLLMLAIFGGMATTAYRLSDETTQFFEFLPEAAAKVRQVSRQRLFGGTASPLDRVQEAAAQLEQAATEAQGSASTPLGGVTTVRIEREQFDINGFLIGLTPGLMASIAQLVVVVFTTYFLLAAGTAFRLKMVRLAGPTLSKRRVTVQTLQEITEQIQRYLLTLVLVSAITGVLTWLSYWALGVQQPAVWGVLSFLFNFVPYVGALIITGGSALVGFVQFDSVEKGLVIALVSIVLHTIIGNLLMPWMTGRANRMNPVAVFVGVLAFGWLWGMWGLLLAVPILLVVKTVCDHAEGLHAIGELLGT